MRVRAVNGERRTGAALAAILLVAALLRGCYLVELAHDPETFAPGFDAAFHDYWAHALVSGDWSPPRFFADPEIATRPFFRPPGYPYLLAALYAATDDPLAVRALQMLLGLSSVWLLFRLGRALFGDAVALVAAGGFALTWSPIYFEGELLAPSLSIALLLTASLVWLRWWHRGGFALAFGGGVLLGGLGLVLPNALVLAPLLWLWGIVVARRRPAAGRLRSVLIGLPLGAVLAIAPAALRNLAVAGDLVAISSNGGVNLYIGNNPDADGCSARIPILAGLAPLQGWTCFDEPAIARGVERLVGRPLAASAVSRYFTGLALDWVAAHPGAALALAARKLLMLLGPAEISNNRELELVRAASPTLRWLVTFPWVLSLAAIGAALAWRELRRAPRDQRADFAVLLALAAVALAASYLPFFVAGRYRVPLVPLLWLAGGYGVVAVARRWRADGWRLAAPWLCAFGVLAAAAHVDWTGYRPDAGRYHFQRGDAWRMRGDLDRAIAEFRLAVAAAPGDPLPHNNLGAALVQQGRRDDALPDLEAAVRLAPDYVDARVNLALALAQGGDDDGAIAQLGEAVRRAPSLAPAQKQLGALLLRRGRAADALPHLAAAVRLAARDVQALHLQAIALLDVGRKADAKRALEALLRLAPDHAGARELLQGLR